MLWTCGTLSEGSSPRHESNHRLIFYVISKVGAPSWRPFFFCGTLVECGQMHPQITACFLSPAARSQ